MILCAQGSGMACDKRMISRARREGRRLALTQPGEKHAATILETRVIHALHASFAVAKRAARLPLIANACYAVARTKLRDLVDSNRHEGIRVRTH